MAGGSDVTAVSNKLNERFGYGIGQSLARARQNEISFGFSEQAEPDKFPR
jgi:hypothetical protein